MADPGKPRNKSNAITTPESYPTTTPQLPSGDFTYILEIVMNMQTSMGKLMEAVDSLKVQSSKHGEKLEHMSKVIYAAGVIGGIILVIVGFLANKAADVFIATLKAKP